MQSNLFSRIRTLVAAPGHGRSENRGKCILISSIVLYLYLLLDGLSPKRKFGSCGHSRDAGVCNSGSITLPLVFCLGSSRPSQLAQMAPAPNRDLGDSTKPPPLSPPPPGLIIIHLRGKRRILMRPFPHQLVFGLPGKRDERQKTNRS